MPQGGLGLPNVWLHYLSARLAQTAQWHAARDRIPWLQLEITSVHPFYIPGLLWQVSPNPREIGALNKLFIYGPYTTKNSNFVLIDPLTSFMGDRRFPPAFDSPRKFLWWDQKSLTTLNALTHSTWFYSFTQHQEQLDIPREEFYKFLQIRHFFESLYTFNANPILTPYEAICQDSSREKGTISTIYKYLNNLHLPEKSTAMTRWETDWGTEFSSEEWLDMLQNMHKCTRSIAMKETVVKLHTRWYLSPDRVHKFYPGVPGTCFRGCQSSGTLLHTFWSCPHLQHIWNQAASRVAQITGSMITLTAPICLLFTPIPELPPPTQKLVNILFCAI